MGDSWDDDDFEVQIPSLTSSSANNTYEEEVDLAAQEANKPIVTSTGPSVAALKKAEEAQKALAAKLEEEKYKGETAQQKAAREKKMVEEADHNLTDALFSGKSEKSNSSAGNGIQTLSASLSKISTSNKADHTSFGKGVAQRLSDSSPFFIAAFYKELNMLLKKPDMSLEVLEDILAPILAIKEERAKLAKQAVKANATQAKSKKQIQADLKKHNAKFRDEDYEDNDEFDGKYSKFDTLEDDFM